MIPAARRKTKQIQIGDVKIGGDAPVVVQSMCSHRHGRREATVRQIHELAELGCEIVRIAVPDKEAADALPEIVRQTPVPLIADIHFDYRWALAAIRSGFHGLRLNPGNIRDADKVKTVVKEAKERGIPIRIGVNAGSLPPIRGAGRRRAAAVDGRPHGRGRPLGDQDPGGDGLRQHQDLDEGLRRADDGRGQPPAWRPMVALPAAPRRDRGGHAARRLRAQRHRHRHAAGGGHRRHDPRLAGRRPERRDPGLLGHPQHAEPAHSTARRSSPARPAAASRST